MPIWRDTDPPFEFGKPRESVLRRRLFRLLALEERRPGRFTEEILDARNKLRKESEFNDAIDFGW